MFKRKILDGAAAMFFMFKGQLRSVRSVYKAHIDFYKSIHQLKEKRAMIEEQLGNKPVDLVLNKCIVFELYIKKHKTFTSLKTNI
jgi:hypothetical protein